MQASATGSASAIGSVLGLSGDAQETYAVEHDETGRPVDLRVIATGPFAGSRDLPAIVQPVAGLLATGDGKEGERGYELAGHLDLTDAGNLAAARELLNAIANRRATAAPEQALRRRIDAHGTVRARVLVTHAETTGVGFDFTGGPGSFSAAARIQERSQQLLAASSRAGLTGNGSRGPTAWHERLPLPFGLLQSRMLRSADTC